MSTEPTTVATAASCQVAEWSWAAREIATGPVRLPSDAYVKPCGIKVAMLRAERAYRTALAEEKLSDIVADFMGGADPRSVAAACAFVQRHQRPQKSGSPKP